MKTTIELTEKTKFAIFYPATDAWFAASQTGGFRAHPIITKDITKAKFWDFQKLADNALRKDSSFKKTSREIYEENGNPYAHNPVLQPGTLKTMVITSKYEEVL